MLLSMEPMEALRYLPFLTKDGVIVAERVPFVNIPNYPDMDQIVAALDQYPHVVLVDGEGIAKELRATRSSNMVLLGAASSFIPLPVVDLEGAITQVFERKGESVVAQNVEAFRKGRGITISA
jgi:indolepyruvate ferredoxin oxidoreductase beta subunit